MKKTRINKNILILIIIIVLGLTGYYIYYKNSKVYKEFTQMEEIQELLPYEEEHQEGQEKSEEVKQDLNIDSQKDKVNEQETESGDDEVIIVHITGEVNNWGVYELKEGSRVIDAVNIAGGFTEDADTEKVNLAYVLTDGVKIYIPSYQDNNDDLAPIEYISENSGNNVITGEENMEDSKENILININKATQTELETLPGIGPSTALKIISHRDEQGIFTSIEDIKNVKGIGDSKFENIKNFICI